MATLHVLSVDPARSTLPTTHRRRLSNLWRRSAALLLTGAAFTLTLNLVAPDAAGAPGDEAAAQSARDAAAAEVQRIEGLVAQAEEGLARYTVEAEAAADATRLAERDLVAAQAQAASAAAELEAARVATEQARVAIADLGREAYMTGSALGTSASALLDSQGPEEFLQRAATLDYLGDDRAQRLTAFESVEQQEAQAEQAAQQSLAEVSRVAGVAAETQAAADAQLAQAEAAYASVNAEVIQYRRDLQQAEIQLLEVQGANDAEAAWAEGVNAERAEAAAVATANAQAAASGQAVPPTTGRVTSCYGNRWGAMHYGVDIAARIGTPIYTPAAGRVIQAGPASGFGLAVYIQHADGSITVYGHINDYFVTAGQQVAAGQQIAEVGNKGQSTGPHLHFEVHQGGLYASRVNPVGWLAARGVSLGGGC